MDFEWDPVKNEANQTKHGLSFSVAQYAFSDPKRIISLNSLHSTETEKRYFCFGKVGEKIMTIRFTYRNEKIRIFGAGFWREGKVKYEKQNKIR